MRLRSRRTGLLVLSVVALFGLGAVIWAVVSPGTARTSTGESAPDRPPASVCGDQGLLDGPRSPPPGAVSVAPGQNLGSMTSTAPAGTTFWLVPGVHTLGTDPFAQVVPKPGNRYVGAPGAVLDGQRLNRYAFAGAATGVTVEHLTVRNFGEAGQNNNAGVVNHDAATAWTIRYNGARQCRRGCVRGHQKRRELELPG